MKEKILIIDDSPEMRGLLKYPLLYAGYQVAEAHDGLEAWGMICQQPFDAIITDCEIPLMSGRVLCQHIRQHEAYKQLPIVMLLDESDRPKRTNIPEVNHFLFKNDITLRLLPVVKHVLESQSDSAVR